MVLSHYRVVLKARAIKKGRMPNSNKIHVQPGVE